MAQLRRIILLHTHLDGVVEIDVDAHTNFCGTNASGKTTLQRLIPVFYGEQPNRVVPKTRKKFDEFYLPFANSYIIYEYQRDNAQLCQAVLTRKSEGGVEYRFVSGAYQSELYLTRSQNGVSALSYTQWASAMRAHPDIQVSAKISATSEYRSIIQNDVSALRSNSADNVKLRRLAASFALVSHNHKLRHIEKLVSAVHAKEGKMDTLKSMLAAIFEEDGVTLPTTKVKNTKAREWIAQMRQSMRLEKLEDDFAKLSTLATQLDGTLAQLAVLQPQLEVDYELQKQLRADTQEQFNAVQGQLKTLRENYANEQQQHNASLSKAESDLSETQLRLDDLQNRFDEFASQDMDKLARDIDNLPLWRESLQELVEQHALMVEQHSDLEHKLEQQKSKLAASLQRLSEQNRTKSKQLQQQKDALRESQLEQQAKMQSAFTSKVEQLQRQFNEQTSTLKSQLAVLSHQQNHSLLNAQEQDAMNLCERRLERALQDYQSASLTHQALQTQWQQARQNRVQADSELAHCRTLVHQSEQNLANIQSQLAPESGTLRHYLHQNYPNWQQNIGKVIAPELLERHDLQPDLTQETQSLFGLTVALHEIDLPVHAQQDSHLSEQQTTARAELEKMQQNKLQAEKALKEAHEQSELLREQVEQAQWQLTQAEQDIDYARDSRDRLTIEQQELNQTRKAKLSAQLNEQQTQLEQLNGEHAAQIEAMNDDFQAQKLELQLDWQNELLSFDEQIATLDSQLEEKTASNKSQIKELEQAFNEELSDMGVDPSRIAQSKQRQAQLREQIQQTLERQDELGRYQQFIKLDWKQLRPQLLEKETQLKQLQRDLTAKLAELKTSFNAKRHALDEQKENCQRQLQSAAQSLEMISPLLAQLRELDLSDGANEPGSGDLSERLERAKEALAITSSVKTQLKSQLEQFETSLSQDAGVEFLDRLEYEKRQLDDQSALGKQLKILGNLLHILRDQRQQLLEMGENIGGDLKKFFIVFRDINQRIARQSQRLSEAVADDLTLEGIEKSQVKIISTIDELGFWQPLKAFAKAYDDWSNSAHALPSEAYLNALADVVELLRANEQYQMESLLRLELHLSEGGSELVIKNDRQLLESSSHGMAYLILCKYLLAFTRLMRADANVIIHWPIDEIGTLAYHNVEKLFNACSENQIVIVGAFPNPESDVLMLFKHRYLLSPSDENPHKRQLKRIQPKLSSLAERLAQATETQL
ncbi:ATP-binding protein [Celerinatantimonas sp. MCCC 1A17872]|uniref:ATP-binding protein n=1 Tax=Celerinatantimonas sp. MCCC 1A17872 TaxID=3177514 RepID=UPI0038CBD91E